MGSRWTCSALEEHCSDNICFLFQARYQQEVNLSYHDTAGMMFWGNISLDSLGASPKNISLLKSSAVSADIWDLFYLTDTCSYSLIHLLLSVCSN